VQCTTSLHNQHDVAKPVTAKGTGPQGHSQGKVRLKVSISLLYRLLSALPLYHACSDPAKLYRPMSEMMSCVKRKR